ncbi:hypothetical protein B6U96_15200 [Archaeoglobales archaeon ex4484_92]|nr:MAG: hypothetical protein B6U96_15200 [Archaeoglobales archaeon ex4484_92]
MDKDLEDKFNTIKNELGLSSNAEVVRFLVNRFYKEIMKKGGLIWILLPNIIKNLDFIYRFD